MSFFSILFFIGALLYAFCYWTHLVATKQKNQSNSLLLLGIICMLAAGATMIWLQS